MLLPASFLELAQHLLVASLYREVVFIALIYLLTASIHAKSALVVVCAL